VGRCRSCCHPARSCRTMAGLCAGRRWWGVWGSNPRPRDYEPVRAPLLTCAISAHLRVDLRVHRPPSLTADGLRPSFCGQAVGTRSRQSGPADRLRILGTGTDAGVPEVRAAQSRRPTRWRSSDRGPGGGPSPAVRCGSRQAGQGMAGRSWSAVGATPVPRGGRCSALGGIGGRRGTSPVILQSPPHRP
jgi:hypothetical protein